MAAILDKTRISLLFGEKSGRGQAGYAIDGVRPDLFSFENDPLAAAQTVSLLRASEQASDVPVIFLADEFEDQMDRTLNQAGGVYCLPKPFEPEVLLDLVDRTFCLPHLAVAKVSPPKPISPTNGSD